ncbi:unnamed protein product, partial [Ectocarpus sp. 13 AM-2016]
PVVSCWCTRCLPVRTRGHKQTNAVANRGSIVKIGASTIQHSGIIDVSENRRLPGTHMVLVARKSSPTMTFQTHTYNEPQVKIVGWLRHLPPRSELATTRRRRGVF